jgi:hypothetical protein
MGDELQQFRELRLLLSGESCQKRLLMFLSKPRSGAICDSSCFGQVQGVVTPVALVRPSLQQTFPLELVDVSHHSARERSESAGKCALTEAWRTGQDFENAGVRGSEPQHRQPVGELCGRVCAQLAKQKCRVLVGLHGRCPLVDACHTRLFGRSGEAGKRFRD